MSERRGRFFQRGFSAHLFDVRFHLLVGQAAKLGLEVAQVVDRATAVRRGDDLFWILSDLLGDSSPSSFDYNTRKKGISIVSFE